MLGPRFVVLGVISISAIERERERENVALSKFCCSCLCPASLPHGTVYWSAACECDISLSLTILSMRALHFTTMYYSCFDVPVHGDLFVLMSLPLDVMGWSVIYDCGISCFSYLWYLSSWRYPPFRSKLGRGLGAD